MKFLLSTTLLASLALAFPSPLPQEATSVVPQTDIDIDDSLVSYNFTPAFTSSLDDLFNLLDSIPDSVLESGDEALNQWFIDNDLRDPSADLLLDTTPALEVDDLDLVGDETLVERGVLVARASAWKIAKCVASIVQMIATTAVPAAKLLKIKKYIKALGGVKESVKLLLGATTKAEKLKAGGKALVYLSAELLGISSVKAACF
ncbi:hypothetical protein SMACR_08503 [Sordaria macrospora]|uniref:WGS project CABT00000000 data, contig 2.54 n=2 Tax=Sordaria macrospora TaxID=5147 RepID=F7W9R3_SORMK|nr:uncharacterized protein SMAC_08503 [Sordaria macrospora k-hell]KAA8632174.1 hypothetical protein SMACR_08503 [Sordaria macrospora]KAH7628947.1 hypothetical protein B0T09DRAFT_289335 [Sordaria sp. MPI-SDFR-AT-0083]WPJ57160.1 hypothetical protein SMAC4_08503 [Sordaria macrospora]CCC14054.1 unnamed protein product [Sordaria macrospora k-hell]